MSRKRMLSWLSGRRRADVEYFYENGKYYAYSRMDKNEITILEKESRKLYFLCPDF